MLHRNYPVDVMYTPLASRPRCLISAETINLLHCRFSRSSVQHDLHFLDGELKVIVASISLLVNEYYFCVTLS